MITQAILTIIFGLLNTVFGVFPAPDDINILNPINEAYASILPYLKIANGFFPVDKLVIILSIIFGIETFILVFRGLNWTYDKVRGSG